MLGVFTVLLFRWARDPQGQVMKNEGKPVLEFIAIYREYDSEWAIPGVSNYHS